MIITLSGDDNDRISRRLDELLAGHLPTEMADFNLLRLDGATLTVDELRGACDALPFLGGSRVVVVNGLSKRFGDGDADKGQHAAFLKALADYLPSVPESTVLIFVERRKLPSTGPGRVLRAAGDYEECALPEGDRLAPHLVARAEEQGAKMDADAARLLAEAVGPEPHRLGPELDKLLAYADGDRIRRADVLALVDIPVEARVWDLTDALFARNAPLTIRSFRTLVEQGEAPQKIVGAIASQIRNLVIAEDYRSAGAEKLSQATGMKPYAARKAIQAVRGMQPGEPARMLSALTELDLEVKMGRADLVPALEMFLVRRCARRA